jgi:hypothetical protein
VAHQLDFAGFKADAVEKIVRLLAMLGAVNADLAAAWKMRSLAKTL